jgi:hypothetical protein
MRIKLADLAKMSKEEKDATLEAFVKKAQEPPTKEVIAEWKNKIAKYEEQYEMSSDEMRKKLKLGEITETFEICKWLMDLHVLDRILKPNEVG